MKKLFFLFLFLFQNIHAGECGRFQIKGRLLVEESKNAAIPMIKVFKGTKSEIKLKIKNQEDFIKISSKLNQFISLEVDLVKALENQEGEIEKIHFFKNAIENPLNPESEKLLLKESKCVN